MSRRAFRRHKYGVAARADRTHNGVVYHSRAEMLYAIELERLPDVRSVVRQVPVQLGPDFKTVVDFMVEYTDGRTEYVEVKGHETPDFERVLRLWEKYRPGTLRVVRRGRRGFETYRVVEGKQ